MGAVVYILCFPNGKLYVGITTKTAEQRFQEHCKAARKGSSCAVHNAIRRYGPEAIRLVTLRSKVAWEEAKRLETEWIAYLDVQDKRNGYNRTAGGDGSAGCIPSAETKQRISNALRGKPKTGRALVQVLANVPKAVEAAAETHRRLWKDPVYRARMEDALRRGRRTAQRNRALRSIGGAWRCHTNTWSGMARRKAI